jgi:hypothetical protein
VSNGKRLPPVLFTSYCSNCTLGEAVSKVVNSTWEAAFLWNRGIMDFTVPCDDMPRVEFYANGWDGGRCAMYDFRAACSR